MISLKKNKLYPPLKPFKEYLAKKKYRKVLVLSSGGARGAFHIGFLKGLEEEKLYPDAIIGVSMGAVVATFFSAGKLSLLEEYLKNLDFLEILPYYDLRLPLQGGAIQGKKIQKFFQELLGEIEFPALKIDVFIIAVDLYHQEEVVFGKGRDPYIPLQVALNATVAIPGILKPVLFKDMHLIDGGLLNRFPIDYLPYLGAQKSIGIDLHQNLLPFSRISEGKKGYNPRHTIKVLARSVDTMYLHINRLKQEKASLSLHIQPPLKDFHMLRFHQAKEMIDLGYLYFYKYKKRVRRLLK